MTVGNQFATFPRMQIVAAGVTDVGQTREHNEDSFCILPEFDLYIVADGMGGHRAGDVASRMATHTIASFFQATAKEDATWPFHFDPHLTIEENRLITGIRVANKRIYETSSRHREVHGMGTTVVGALVSRERNRMYFAHVGDSRAYRIRKGDMAAGWAAATHACAYRAFSHASTALARPSHAYASATLPGRLRDHC